MLAREQRPFTAQDVHTSAAESVRCPFRKVLEAGQYHIVRLAPRDPHPALGDQTANLVERARDRVSTSVGEVLFCPGEGFVPPIGHPVDHEEPVGRRPIRQRPVPDSAGQVQREPEDLDDAPRAVVAHGGEIAQRPDLRCHKAAGPGQVHGGVEQGDRLALSTQIPQRRALVVERLGDDPLEAEVLREIEGQVGRMDRLGWLATPHERTREVRQDRGSDFVAARGGESDDRGLEHHDRLRRLPGVDEDLAQECLAGAGIVRWIGGPGEVDPRANECLGIVVSRGCVGGRRRPKVQGGALARIGGDRDRLANVRDRLVVGTECRGPLGRARQSQARLDPDGIGLGAVGRGSVGRDVVGGEGTGQFVVAERLEIASRGEVSGAPLALRQGPVGDLADQRLDEPVLTPLRAARIHLDVEQLPPHEGLEPWLEGLGGLAADRGESCQAE